MLIKWKHLTMRDICTVNQGFQINISRREKHKRDDNKLYITIQHLNNIGDDEYINDKDHNLMVECNENDILMTRTGNTGKVVTGVKGVFHNNFFKINFDREKIDKDYLIYYLNTPHIQQLILSKAGTSTIPDLNHVDFYSIPFTYPENIEDQRNIALNLKDLDILLSMCEKLIIKKNNMLSSMINNYTSKEIISELFGYELKKISLSSVGYSYNGLSGLNSTNFGYGDKKYITFLNILKNPVVNDKMFEKFNCNNNQKEVKKGDVFFNSSSEIPEEVAMSSTIDYECNNLYLNSFCFGYRITDESIDNLYLSYFFRGEVGRNIIKGIAQGSTRFNLPKSKFMDMEFYIPKDKNVQRDLANQLNDMTKDLELIKYKRIKYQKIKEGIVETIFGKEVIISNE